MIGKTIPFWVKKKVGKIIPFQYSRLSYSQEGEDMILRRIFEGKQKGFYIDVGAHHPKRFSNTYFFYKKGWTGINIDAMPGSMRAFNKKRRKDINIECPILNEAQRLIYYIFDDPALNGFSKELSQERRNETNYNIVSTIELQTKKLSDILKEYLPKNTIIDFLSVDVEGLDLEVLKSNDWTLYKPKVVLVEMLGKSIESLINDEITYFLKKYNYLLYAKCVNTVFFKREG
jgi:FkbM family methyltransferase